MTDFSITSSRVTRAADALVGRNAMLSYPIPDIVNGIRAERFFIYVTGSSKIRERPFAVLTASMDGGLVLDYTDCRVRDYFDTEKYPMDQKIDYSLPKKLSMEEFRLQQSTINKLYELVRRAAFQESLTGQERRAVTAWYVMLENAVPRSLIPFYQAIGKNFYEWVVRYV